METKNIILKLRTERGMSQDELADKIMVTRQAVSRWENGYSVPDAEMLKKIAEILETDVSQLLGSSIEETSNTDLVAEQLSRINEQLVIKNRRTRRIWKTIGVVILVVIIVQMILVVLGAVAFDNLKFNSDVQVEEYSEEFIDE